MSRERFVHKFPFWMSFTGVAMAIVGCSGQADTASSSQSQAQSAVSAAADGGFDPSACLTTYVECVRAADGGDVKACHDALHACLPPPPPKPDGHDCDGHDGPPGDHGPEGDGGAMPPPPPPSGSNDRPPPPPPPPGASGDPNGPPPPPPGPGRCFHDLDDCARGSDPVATCVQNAVTCLADAHEAPPPPRQGM